MKNEEQSIEFKLGDHVEWDSSSNGTLATKRGIVIEVVEAGKRPNSMVGCWVGRKHVSYVIGDVWAQRWKNGKQKFVKMKETYWPIASKLRHQKASR